MTALGASRSSELFVRRHHRPTHSIPQTSSNIAHLRRRREVLLLFSLALNQSRVYAQNETVWTIRVKPGIRLLPIRAL